MVVESGQHESLGQELKRLREQRGWTLEAASKVTRIKPDQIDDIEADNYVNFPSVAYVRGFVRIYAKSLGLDDRKVVARLDGKLSDAYDDEPSLIPLSALESSRMPSALTHTPETVSQRIGSQIISGLVILIIGGMIFLFYRVGGLKNYPSAPSGNPSSSVPRAEPVTPTTNVPRAEPVTPPPSASSEKGVPHAAPVTADATPADAADVFQRPAPSIPRAEPIRPSLKMELQARAEVWLRVNVNGNTEAPAYDGMMGPGQALSWEGQTFFIEARPPNSLMISFNGEPLKPLSEDTAKGQFTFP
jgi:cytoskeletal protein RodZ